MGVKLLRSETLEKGSRALYSDTETLRDRKIPSITQNVNYVHDVRSVTACLLKNEPTSLSMLQAKLLEQWSLRETEC